MEKYLLLAIQLHNKVITIFLEVIFSYGKNNNMIAFLEYFINNEDELMKITEKMKEPVKQNFINSFEEAKKLSWFEKMKNMKDPIHFIQQLKQGKYLPSICLKTICRNVKLLFFSNFHNYSKVKPILFEEPTVIYTQSPITIVGNIVGHIESLLKIFELRGLFISKINNLY